MKMEKKTVALSILALVIGIAAVIPIAYFMDGNGIGSTAQAKPWFDIDMLYANAIPNPKTGGNSINVVANFTLTPAGISLKGADAKVEVFNFHIYSDKSSIDNITYCITRYGEVNPTGSDNYTSAIRGNLFGGYWLFVDGSSYNLTDVLGVEADSIYSSGGINFDAKEEKHVTGYGRAFLSEDNGEKSTQSITNLKEASVLYVDITRVMTITYKHQTTFGSSSLIATTTGSNKVLYHAELAKTDFGFASGSVPDFMQKPADYDGNGYVPWWWGPLLPPSSSLITKPITHVYSAPMEKSGMWDVYLNVTNSTDRCGNFDPS